ncbi:MAG TPA: hypothetical protein VIQ23_15230 [Hanamia sp.]
MKKAYTVTYFDEVENDVSNAKAWYKSKKNGLEKRFAKAIKLAIVNLQKTPTAYAIRYKNVRIAYPAVFPYAIHFYIDEQQNIIVITAIVFAGRDPDFAKTRI